ncbi:MAG: TIGR00289 family protein [Candidatus Aenigmarchaeota archaeon]|nr:TIGR00289 family protein [Candidatus Aenigmarchaeota archaeon]
MGIAVLFSGGKDSVRTVHHCLKKGYDVKYLVTMISRREDSWMFHVPNIRLTELSSEAIDIPLISKETSGKKEEEVEDLKKVLKILDIDAVACGGIFSNYQKTRFEKVCKELKLKLLSPFWHADPEHFMRETIDLGFDVRIVGVYAEGFDKSWLGREIDKKTVEDLKELNEKYGVSLVGEGGEYETFVVDGLIFKKRIKIVDSEKIWDRKTQSGWLWIKKAVLIDK